jgi:hypothetical protein
MIELQWSIIQDWAIDVIHFLFEQHLDETNLVLLVKFKCMFSK